jgi:hypothetical protein
MKSRRCWDRAHSVISLSGTIYAGYDPKLQKKVALKIEKPDKSKRVLLFEYQVLRKLQGPPLNRFTTHLQSIRFRRV